MDYGLLRDLIFPEHRHAKFSGGYSASASYCEIFDILASTCPAGPYDSKIFDGYKVLFAPGGQDIDRAYKAAMVSTAIMYGGVMRGLY